MTQATATEAGTKILTRSAVANPTPTDIDVKYISPFMPILKKSQQESKKKKKYPTHDIYPELNYRGSAQGLMGIFRACKQIQLRAGRDFKEEYIMIRKRARSLQNRPPNEDDLMHGFT